MFFICRLLRACAGTVLHARMALVIQVSQESPEEVAARRAANANNRAARAERRGEDVPAGLSRFKLMLLDVFSVRASSNTYYRLLCPASR